MRVLQVGLGDLGRRLVAATCRSGLGRVTEAVDPGEHAAGRRLDELVPETAGDVTVRADLREIRDWESVDAAIVATSSKLPEALPVLAALAERGLPVVSTCEELVWPRLRHPKLADELDAVARARGARLLGTGVNPGFLMDALPAFASVTCTNVSRIAVERRIAADRRRASFQRKVGIGWSVEGARDALARAEIGHVGLGESLHLLAHHAGLGLDRWEEDRELVLASRDLEGPGAAVPRGQPCGVHQVARGWRADRLVAELTFQAAWGVDEPMDRIVLLGEPGLELLIPGGLDGDAATTSIVLNAVAAHERLPVGLSTMGDVPLLGRSTA